MAACIYTTPILKAFFFFVMFFLRTNIEMPTKKEKKKKIKGMNLK
jgi:hypothetical protein